MQDAARRGQRGGTHRCNPPLGVANSSPCLLAHPAGYIMDNCTRLDTAILQLRALYDVQKSLAQRKCSRLTMAWDRQQTDTMTAGGSNS